MESIDWNIKIFKPSFLVSYELLDAFFCFYCGVSFDGVMCISTQLYGRLCLRAEPFDLWILAWQNGFLFRLMCSCCFCISIDVKDEGVT